MPPLSRAAYFASGITLMGLKYLGDALLVYAGTGRIWVPADYAASLLFDLSLKLADAPTWLLWAMGAWVLPFVFVGVRLTMRRAIDAGWTPWVALAFFVPYVNYGLMLLLCLRASAPPRRAPSQGVLYGLTDMNARRAMALAVAGGASLGLVMIGVCVYWLRNYGAGLLIGTPYAVGVLAAFVLVRLHREASDGETLAAGLLSVTTIAALAVLAAMEGAICVLMAAPLALILAGFGAVTGRAIGRRGQEPFTFVGLGLMALPLAAVLEPAPVSVPVAREVMTAIEIAAPPAAVWPHVVAFTPLPEPADWLSRAGISFPVSARIAGTGVGAVRYCEFSTGAFVEPITAWEPGRRLAFDVTYSPPPLRELSPYPHVRAPHLDGFLRSRRGEFRLVALANGGTRLEGRTWYELDMVPEGYWRVYADWIIHGIHRRVLRHIKSQVE